MNSGGPLREDNAGDIAMSDAGKNPENQSQHLTLQDITSQSEFNNYASGNPSTLLVLYFHASWAEVCKNLTSALETLATTYTSSKPLAFLRIDADEEELSDIAEQYEVSAVPYIVLQRGGQVVDSMSNPTIAAVRSTVEKHAGSADGNPAKFGLPPVQQVQKPAGEQSSKDLSGYAPSASAPATAPEYSSGAAAQQESKEELNSRLGELVKAAPVMLFMKGTPSAPQCGFSRQTVSLLREKGVRYGFFNILADDDVRQGLKEFSEWPTFPQVYCDGELVGGLDIVS